VKYLANQFDMCSLINIRRRNGCPGLSGFFGASLCPFAIWLQHFGCAQTEVDQGSDNRRKFLQSNPLSATDETLAVEIGKEKMTAIEW
jgi:hypothetical protein